MKTNPRRVFLILIIVLAVFTAFSVAGERGFYQLGKMIKRRSALSRDVQSLKEENTLLAHEIDRLRSDPVFLEELARTRLGMVRPGEVVFIFPENTGDDVQ